MLHIVKFQTYHLLDCSFIRNSNRRRFTIKQDTLRKKTTKENENEELPFFPTLSFVIQLQCNARQKLSKAGLRSCFLPFIQQLEDRKPTVEKMLPCLVRREGEAAGRQYKTTTKRKGGRRGRGKTLNGPSIESMPPSKKNV